MKAQSKFRKIRYFQKSSRWVLAALIGLLSTLVVGCSAGPMKVKEVHYCAVSNGQNTNYYRLKVSAKTRLGDAQYRSGWFPAHAVDSLFGDVTSKGSTQALKARHTLEEQIREAVVDTNKAWLEEAMNPDAKPEKLDGLLQARRRVLAYPRGDNSPYPGTSEIQYNPAKGIAAYHADEKLVFMLSSNPDQVVEKIANFAQNKRTAMSINELGNIFSHRVLKETAEQEANEEAVEEGNQQADLQVQGQIALALTTLGGLDTKDREDYKQGAINQIDTLLSIIDAFNP